MEKDKIGQKAEFELKTLEQVRTGEIGATKLLGVIIINEQYLRNELRPLLKLLFQGLGEEK